MKVKMVVEGLRDPKDNPCWKGYKPVGTKKKNGKTVPNCVPKESMAEGESDVQEVGVKKLTSLITQQNKRQGGAEGGDNIWGPQGNFAGDPVSIGTTITKKPIKVGQRVKVNYPNLKGVGEVTQISGENAKVWINSYAREYVIPVKDLREYPGKTLDEKGVAEGDIDPNRHPQTLDYGRGESDFGEPGEILEDVLTVLERKVEWPLTEIMDYREVQQLLQPIRSAVNAELRIITREKNKSLSEADVMSKISAATAKDVTIDNPDGTKTVVPMATGMLSKDEQGNLVLNKAAAAMAGKTAAAGGAQQQPIKPGQQVRVSTEPSEDVHRVSAAGTTHGDEVTDTNTKSAISGDEDHDEITKLLVQRLRKLAGIDRMTDESAEEQPPPMPDIQGLSPGTSKDLGNGERVTLKQDGTVSYAGGFGEYIYDKTGRAIKYNSPNFAGSSQSKDLSTGGVTKSYAAGPMSVKQGTDGKTSAEYDLAGQKLKFGSNPKR